MNNVNNIAENKTSVNSKKEKKSYKIIATLYNDYCLGGKRPFYKDGNKWVADSSRDIAARTGIPYRTVNKKLNSLKRENLIEYDYVNEFGYGKRKYAKEPKKFRFTPKGMKLLVEPLSERLKPREEKKGHTVTEETNRNNLYIYKSSNEDVFNKFNNSLVAKAWYELRKRGYFDKITAGKSRYLHAFLNFIGENCDSYEKFCRLINYLNWVEETLGKISLHRLLNFKLFRKFFANLNLTIDQELEQWNALKYWRSTDKSTKTFQNNFEIISNNSFESVQSILENLEFLRFNTVV